MRNLTKTGMVLGGLIAAAVVGPAHAGVISIEPDNYAAGTVLNSVVPGVTLSSINGADAASGNITSTAPSWGAASTGTLVFGGAFAASGDSFGNGTWDFMLIDVSALGGFVSLSIDFVATDTDKNPVLAGYDAAGNLVDSDNDGGTFGSGEFVNLTVSGASITRIAALGDPGSINFATFAGINNQASGGNDSWGLDNITITTVPEPAALALFGIGLVGLGFAARRRRKAD